MVEKEFGIKILQSERSEVTFANFGTFADFVKKNINKIWIISVYYHFFEFCY